MIICVIKLHVGSKSASTFISRATAAETNSISQKFTAMWTPEAGQCPSIDRIFSICNNELRQRWDEYRSKLPTNIVEEYFHGTRLDCDITSTSTLCTNQDCGICGIVNIGLDRIVTKAPKKLGYGFYLAPNSPTSHKYTQGKCGYRAMSVLDICPGKKYMTTIFSLDLRAPPEGYNSVYGQSGSYFDCEEIAIYNQDGALPKYIIMYRLGGEEKIANTQDTDCVCEHHCTCDMCECCCKCACGANCCCGCCAGEMA